VQIPRTGRSNLFRRRLKETLWVDKMIDGMIPVSLLLNEIALDLDGDDEVGTARRHF
jgi:hypothetical protein